MGAVALALVLAGCGSAATSQTTAPKVRAAPAVHKTKPHKARTHHTAKVKPKPKPKPHAVTTSHTTTTHAAAPPPKTTTTTTAAPPPTTTTTAPPPPPTHHHHHHGGGGGGGGGGTACIPQTKKGTDGDGDNAGGPSDGDGCI